MDNDFGEFKIERHLLDANFEGYKLSLNALSNYTLFLDTATDSKRLPNDLYSYQHLKAFGLANKLYADPWNENFVYFIDYNWKIMSCHFDNILQIYSLSPKTHMIIHDDKDRKKLEHRVPASLHFTSEEWLVVSDGSGRLFIIHSGSRNHMENWTIYFEREVLGQENYFIILHSTTYTFNRNLFIEVLCLHVKENTLPTPNTDMPNFVTVIDWLTFVSSDKINFELIRNRSLQGTSVPDYGAIVVIENGHQIESDDEKTYDDSVHCCCIVVVCEKPFEFIYDSMNKVENYQSSKTGSYKEDDQSLYIWTQKEKEIKVYIKLKEGTKKDDIICVINTNQIYLKFNSINEVVFDGELSGKVVNDKCIWTISEGSELQIYLEKADESTWKEVVIGDKRGRLMFDDGQISAINDILAPFTDIDNMKDENLKTKNNFNLQQLEECDEISTETYSVVCYQGNTHEIIHQINLSNNQWLFMTPTSSTNVPLICVRYDVDGLVFQLKTVTDQPETILWKHIATFNAFGYIQASKQQRKFTVCPANFSYVAILETVKHIFIYKQSAVLDSQLQNRKTNKSQNKIAKQYVVSLDNNEIMDGAVASNDHLFILSGKNLHCIKISES